MSLIGVFFHFLKDVFVWCCPFINYVGVFIMWRKTVQTYNAKIKLATDILRKALQILFLFLRGEDKIQI